MKTQDSPTKPETLEVLDDRFYVINDEYFPSVTTILSCYPKGSALTKWIAENGWNESNRLKNEAANKGSNVHAAIQKLFAGEKLDYNFYEEDEWTNLRSFINFAEDYKPIPEDIENTIISEKYKYAGTMDFSGTVEVKDDELSTKKEKALKRIFVRFDWKTSNNFWPEYDLQLSAYESAEVEVGKKPADELWIVRFGTETARGYSIHKVKDRESKMEAFHHVRWLWNYTHPNAKPFQKEIPKFLKLI